MIFAMFAKYLMMVASVSHILETWQISSVKLLWGERGECLKLEFLVYIFPVLRYYALFAGRCLNGRGESGTLSSPDLAILHHDLYKDRTFRSGTIVAWRLHTNRTKGSIFGGVCASCLAKHFEIPIRHDEKEEMRLPTKYLDYASMVAHDFIGKDDDKRLLYNLVSSQGTCEIITLPAPSLFNIHSGRYIIIPNDIYTYLSLTQSPVSEPAPVPDPYQELVYQWEPQELANQWNPQDPRSIQQRVILSRP